LRCPFSPDTPSRDIHLQARLKHISSPIKAFGLALAFCLFLNGCSRINYIVHATAGQIRIMASVETVEDLTAKGALNPSQLERIALIQEVKTYAEKEFGVRKTKSYSKIYPRPVKRVLLVVCASPKDALTLKTWWFPVVGRMPYLGFFNPEKAEREKENLERQGYDVIVRDAEAYSTLGWFSDPITMNMLDSSPVVLVDTIIHELTHATLYVKGQGSFNEGLALFMGRLGAARFLESTRGPDHAETQLAWRLVHDERLFSGFLDGLLKELESFYASTLTREEKIEGREKVYLKGLEKFKEIKPLFKTTLFWDFDQKKINNAELLSIALYHRYFSLFEAVYDLNGRNLRSTLHFFVRLVRESREDLLLLTRERLRTQRAAGKEAARRPYAYRPPGFLYCPLGEECEFFASVDRSFQGG
jgi:predicted aminopeptidase